MKKIFSILAAVLFSATMFADKTLYLNIGVWKDGDAAANFKFYTFEETNQWISLAAVEGETNVYSCAIPDAVTGGIFCRVNPDGNDPDAWKNVWNQTEDLTIPDGKDLFKVTTWEGSSDGKKHSTGEWSKFSASEPVDPENLPVVGLAGTFNNWNWEGSKFVPANDGKTAGIKVNLTKGVDSLKIVSDGHWLTQYGGDEPYRIKRDWPKVEPANRVDVAGNNIVIDVDLDGEYLFTWRYADSTLLVTYPAKAPVDPKQVALAGDWNGWKADVDILTPATDEKTASIKVNLTKAQKWGFKVVLGEKWLSAGAEGVDYKRGGEAIAVKHEGGEGNNIFIDADIAGEYTITWTYADSTVAVAFPELPELNLEDGYYLIGLTGWSLYALTADQLLEKNTGLEEGEEYFKKNVVLEEGQEFKVVKVESNDLKTWFGMGESADNANDNYKVSADVKGTRDIYFRPEYKADWKGHIFVNWEATAIDNTAVEAKAVKMIENGQIVIIKNGVRYNVLGAQF